MAKVKIEKESILQHDFDRAPQQSERSNWQHLIILDPRECSVDVCTLFGNGTPMSVHDGRAFVLTSVSDGVASTETLVEALESEDIQDSLQAICDGYSEEWDGSNWRGNLTEAADDLLESVTDSLQSIELPTYWEASDWYEPCSVSDLMELALDPDRESVLCSEESIAIVEGAYLSRTDISQYLDSILEDYCHDCCCSKEWCECKEEPNG